MTYMAAFGIAAGAGAKAFIPILALGAFSYTPYFELSSRFEWIADPMVMAVLGVLVIAEIVVDAHPDLGRFSDVISYLPKVVAGFIAFAAVTGRLDDNLVQLGTSGSAGWRYGGRRSLAPEPGAATFPRSGGGRPRDHWQAGLGR